MLYSTKQLRYVINFHCKTLLYSFKKLLLYLFLNSQISYLIKKEHCALYSSGVV